MYCNSYNVVKRSTNQLFTNHSIPVSLLHSTRCHFHLPSTIIQHQISCFLRWNTYSFSISFLPHYTANKYFKHTYRNEQEGLTVNDTPSQMIGAPLTSLFSILSFYLVALSLAHGSQNHRSRPHPVSPCIGKWHVHSIPSFCKTHSLFFTTQRGDCAPCARRQPKVEHAAIDDWEHGLLESGCVTCASCLEGVRVCSEQLLGHDERWEDAVLVEGFLVLLRRHEEKRPEVRLFRRSRVH